ncbi:MAG: hypothetical protein WD032_04455 [Nitrospirales bacterium]
MKTEMRPCFAVDIDNVLGRAEPEVQRLFQEITGTPWPTGKYGSAGGLDTSEIEHSLMEEIFTRFHDESIPQLALYPGAKYVLGVLHQTCRIIIVTARRPYSRPQTLTWLSAHGLSFDALYHTEEKTEIPECITVAVDDHPVHLQSYQAVGARVFVMDQPWNRLVSDPNVIRVSGWDALLQWWHFRFSGSWPNRLYETPSPQHLWRRLPISA